MTPIPTSPTIFFTKLPPAPYISTEYAAKSAPATRLLQDGDIVDLGDRQFEVIHTPGHSPGVKGRLTDRTARRYFQVGD